MRSYALTAALAATLLTTSLTLGYANTSNFTPNTRAAKDSRPDEQPHGIADAVPPVVLYPQGTMTPATGAFTPKAMTYHRVIHRNPRLSLINHELSRATRRIEAGRQRGYLTAMEARKARIDERAIRTAAAAIVERHGGRLPDAQFIALQERVTDLNRMIHRFANNSARA